MLCCLNCDVTRDLLFNLCFVHQPKMADSRWRKFPAPLFTIFTWTVMQLVYPPKILHNLLSLISLGMTVIPRRNWKQWHMHNVFLAGEGGGEGGGIRCIMVYVKIYVSQLLDFIKHLTIETIFLLYVCFKEKYKNSAKKFYKMTSGFVIVSIKLCPPSGLLEPPPGSRQKKPGIYFLMTITRLPFIQR